MHQECRLPHHAWMQHRWWDMLVYAIDHGEWQKHTATGHA